MKEKKELNMELWHSDFYDVLQVLRFGAKKHGAFNWLDVNGRKSSHKDMHSSMFRHLADSYAGISKDEESGLHPLLHLACRSLMMYVRLKHGLDKGRVPHE